MLISARFDDGTEMSDSEVRDQLMTLLLAGHETTATGAWLGVRPPLPPPGCATSAWSRRFAPGTITPTSTPSSPRRSASVRSSRSRAASCASRSTFDGFDFEPGQIILASIWLTHTRPDLYPEPFAFRPERFLDGAPETYSWVPFGGGTRRCIGAAFAQLEMRVALQTIIRECDLRPGVAGARAPDPPQRDDVAREGHARDRRALDLGTAERIPQLFEHLARDLLECRDVGRVHLVAPGFDAFV